MGLFLCSFICFCSVITIKAWSGILLISDVQFVMSGKTLVILDADPETGEIVCKVIPKDMAEQKQAERADKLNEIVDLMAAWAFILQIIALYMEM